MSDPYLELADWRRQVAAIWDTWRRDCVGTAGAERATAAFRAARDDLFRHHAQSPLAAVDRGAAFRGLTYFPYDPRWRMTVQLEPDVGAAAPETEAPSPPMVLPSSGSGAIAFRRIGSVVLAGPLAGERLSVFWIDSYGGGLFLPFRDATGGAETYEAGRYLLDTIKGADHGGDPAAGSLVLDFNLAYCPSCAYDPRWACPLAPPENRLHGAVRAGERLPS